jgi:hypothetical protein
MNNVYLIDYENLAHNIQYFITDGIPVSGDEVYVFFSKINEKFPISVILQAQENGISLKFIEAFNGHANALDFQLSSYLGFLICKNPEKIYHIMSLDKGYDSTVDFWRKQEININRLDTFMNSAHYAQEQEAINAKKMAEKNVQKNLKKRITRNDKKELLKSTVNATDFSEVEKHFIITSFFNANSKERFCQLAKRRYGEEMANKMANSIGHLFVA